MTKKEYLEQKKRINELSHDTYWILVAISLVGDVMPKSSIHKLLNDARVGSKEQNIFTATSITKHIDILVDLGICTQTKKELQIKEEWKIVVLRTGVIKNSNRIKSIGQAIDSTFKYSESLQFFYYLKEHDIQRIITKLHLCFYLQDQESYEAILNRLPQVAFDARLEKVTESLSDLLLPLDAAFFKKQSPFFQELVIDNIFYDLSKWDNETALDLERLLINHPDLYTGQGDIYRLYLTHIQLMRGAWIVPFRVRDELQKYPSWAGLLAMKSIAAGKIDEAEETINLILQKSVIPYHFFDVLYFIYKARTLDAQIMSTLFKQLNPGSDNAYPGAFSALRAYFIYQLVDEYKGYLLLNEIIDHQVLSPLDKLVLLWCSYWMNNPITPEQIDIQLEDIRFWQSIGLNWLAGEMANTLAHHLPKGDKATKKYASIARKVTKEQGIHYLLPIMPREEIWERTLNTLEQVNAEPEFNPNVQESSFRLVWFVDFEQKEITPKEQKLTKNGAWSSGRKIGLTRILEGTLDSITEQDRSLKDALSSIYHEQVYPYYQYSDDDLILDFEHALYLLKGHPFLFLAGKQQLHLTIIEAQPELFITEEEAGLKVYFKPYSDSDGFQLEKETPTRYKIYKLTENQAKISRAVGTGVNFPNEAKQRLEAVALELRKQVSVQSTTDLLLDENLREVKGSPKPCFQIIPHHTGFKIELFVKPLHPESHYFKPGEGLSKIVVSTENGRVALLRDLKEEEQQADTIIKNCPILEQLDNDHYEWLLSDDQQCLQLLYELRPYWEEEHILLEHPKGEKIRLAGISSSQDFSMRIRKERDWFSVDGQLDINEEAVLNFRQLLEHVRQSDSQFVQLKNGEYLALTEQLQKRLMDIDSLLHQKGSQLQLSGLSILQMDSITQEIKALEVDNAWQESLARIHKAQNIRPQVPANFKAELRDYQKEGYRWLMRLAEWGVGACLADDMGLGKTVQALAMLSARSDKGPSLVIAPASVTRNWLRETERFTPNLKAKLLASSKELDMLNGLEAGDVLLLSYGLLPFIEEALSTIPFANLVLDEAQAIKNSATKRSKAAKKIQADFRLATTGTPIENHLGELWNLFHFLNPGLLGGRKSFSDKFAKPITRDNDELRREQLRRLIRPFILRRRKEEVLTELPPKTEITLTVELSEKERAFYEALRQNALDEIEAADGNAKRFTILAQLTRLRQAACHPLLVKTNSRIPSSKLELVGETILEILDNGHKALVFSQFVKHLRLVEQWVKGAGISYQYLDGQTPGKQREKAVNDFQNGEGQLFLISLKAGGTGLNLTEADYVLHLDPWWNPAVENQASDRAHRIGQQRPVTVYRFVSEQTIEEKIVALHQEKQALADQLLSGTDASAKLTVDDMLELLK